jgi:hypothetical protein
MAISPPSCGEYSTIQDPNPQAIQTDLVLALAFAAQPNRG